MMLNELIWDNPILIKHVRARLRAQHLLPWIAVIFIFSACILYAGLMPSGGQEDVEEASRNASIAMLVLQGLILFLGGASQVASSVMSARESGILDFHRITPLRPLTVAVGFLLGAPVREFILFVLTMPFLLVLVYAGNLGVPGLLLVWLEMLLLALVYYSVGMLAALVLPKSRGAGVLIVLIVIALNLLWMVQPFTYFTMTPTILAHLDWSTVGDGMRHGRHHYMGFHPIYSFFGVTLPAFLLSLLHQIPMLIFLFLAGVRKMRHESAYAYSRPLAVIFFAVLAVLILGDTVVFEETIYLSQENLPSIIFGLLGVGFFLSSAVTPGAGDFIKGIRHARKLGLSHVPLWSDLAANWVPALALGGILLLAGGAASLIIGCNMWEKYDTQSLLVTTVIAVTTLLTFALAKQLFSLLFRKNGQTYFLLTMFILWIVPMMIGAVALITEAEENVVKAIMSVSPISGMIQILDTEAYYTEMHSFGLVTLAISLALLAVCAVIYIVKVSNIIQQLMTSDEGGCPV